MSGRMDNRMKNVSKICIAIYKIIPPSNPDVISDPEND